MPNEPVGTTLPGLSLFRRCPRTTKALAEIAPFPRPERIRLPKSHPPKSSKCFPGPLPRSYMYRAGLQRGCNAPHTRT
jgi:hypothetical protein